jgi:hypothetical protein
MTLGDLQAWVASVADLAAGNPGAQDRLCEGLNR